MQFGTLHQDTHTIQNDVGAHLSYRFRYGFSIGHINNDTVRSQRRPEYDINYVVTSRTY